MKVFIIGAGVMGGAIAKILARNGQKVFVQSRTFTKAKTLVKLKNITAEKNFANLSSADMVIIAVKPQDVPALSAQIRGRLKATTLLISIAAGVKLRALQKLFNHKKVVRVMPTLALTVGQGIALWQAVGLSEAEKHRLKRVLRCFTEEAEAPSEHAIDTAAIIYGCGPAYFFLLADALQKGGVALGISPKFSRRLVEKTFLGAALLQDGRDYSCLIAKIASKKGITEAVLRVFAKKNFYQMVNQALMAGDKRTKELSHA